MDDQIRKSELRHQARMRLGAQRGRVRLLRRRVIVTSLLAFALLWGVVFAQMVSGNDPVLGNTESKTVASTRKLARQQAVTVERTPSTESDDTALSAGEAETGEIEAMEAEAAELETAEIETAEIEAAEAEALAAEAEAVTTSPS